MQDKEVEVSQGAMLKESEGLFATQTIGRTCNGRCVPLNVVALIEAAECDRGWFRCYTTILDRGKDAIMVLHG